MKTNNGHWIKYSYLIDYGWSYTTGSGWCTGYIDGAYFDSLEDVMAEAHYHFPVKDWCKEEGMKFHEIITLKPWRMTNVGKRQFAKVASWKGRFPKTFTNN